MKKELLTKDFWGIPLSVFALVVGGLTVFGQPPALPPAQNPGPYHRVILPGDFLEVKIANVTDGTRSLTVNNTGLVEFPLLAKSIPVVCVTPETLFKSLAQEYRKYLSDPHISVQIRDRPVPAVRVTGAINNEMQFDLRRRATFDELIALAGGATAYANGKITINRPGGWTCNGDQLSRFPVEEFHADLAMSPDVAAEGSAEVRPGDIVTLEYKPLIEVRGDVSRPQRILLETGLTLTVALAMSGGVLHHRHQVHIARQLPGSTQMQLIWVDLRSIAKGRAVDLTLMDNDVLYVTRRNQRSGPLRGVPVIELPLKAVE